MLKAAGKRIVVQEIDLQQVKEKTILILPTRKDYMTAMVRAMGSEVDDQIEFGDIVYLPDDCGVPIEVDGEVLLSVTENQILAAWKDK